jgi:hypothetical protein
MAFLLGKLPAKIDKRTIKFSSILNAANLPPLPPEFDIDAKLGVTDTRMYLNDTYGDCVEAGSCHMINRFEMFECGAIPNIPDVDVKTQYFKETGGGDDGLVLLDHLTLWRKEGLAFGGQTYTIDAFSSIDWKNHKEFAYAVYLLDGVYLGMMVPAFFMSGFEAGKRFFDDSCKNAKIEGGHCIYSMAFNKLPSKVKVVSLNDVGPIIETWGARVQLTWKFCDHRFDEAYAVMDSMDKWVNPAADPLNIPLLKQYLATIQNGC